MLDFGLKDYGVRDGEHFSLMSKALDGKVALTEQPLVIESGVI